MTVLVIIPEACKVYDPKKWFPLNSKMHCSKNLYFLKCKSLAKMWIARATTASTKTTNNPIK